MSVRCLNEIKVLSEVIDEKETVGIKGKCKKRNNCVRNSKC